MNSSIPPDGFADEPAVSGPPDGFADEHSSGSNSYWKSSFVGGPNVSPTSLPQKLDYGLRKGLQVGMDVLNYPFEKTGEAMRVAVEGGPTRASSLAQNTGFAERTEQPPDNPFSFANRMLRTGAAYGTGLFQGSTKKASQYAQSEYERQPGLVDVGSDALLALGLGKYAPKIANAPIQAAENAVNSIKPALSGTGKMVGTAAKRLFGATLGPSEEAINARLQNPAAVGNFTPRSELNQRLAMSAEKLVDQIKEADAKAWETLSKSYTPKHLGYSSEDRAISKEVVQKTLDNVRHELTVYGGGLVGKASKQAAKVIEDLSNDIDSVGKYSGGKIKSLLNIDSAIPKNNFLPENTVKGIIQSLDQNINWDIKESEPVNQALERARIILDGILKKQNPGYEKAMAPVAEKMRLLSDLKKQYHIVSSPTGGLQAGTNTEAALKNALRENRSLNRATLASLKSHTGEDYVKELTNTGYGEQFVPGATRANGSRRVAAGSMLGAAAGKIFGSPFLGTAIGAGTGLYLDTQGGAVAGKIIDAYRRLRPLSSNATQKMSDLQKYGSILENAVREGIPIEIASQELQKIDPDYGAFIVQFPQENKLQPGFSNTNQQSLFRKKAS